MLHTIADAQKNATTLLTGLTLLRKYTSGGDYVSMGGSKVYVDCVNDVDLESGDRTLLLLLGWNRSQGGTWFFDIDQASGG